MSLKAIVARFGAPGVAIWCALSVGQFALYAPIFKHIFALYAKLLGL